MAVEGNGGVGLNSINSGGQFRRAAQRCLELLYPPRCPMCEQIVSRTGEACAKCRKALPYAGKRLCQKCGRPLGEWHAEVFCAECRKRMPLFEQGRSVFVYQEPVALALARLKYQNRREYVSFFAKEALRAAGPWIVQIMPEAVLPVPIHKSRLRKRGYNQAALLARAVAKPLGLPVREDLLLRTQRTEALKNCAPRQRRLWLEGAFSVKEPPAYKRVLLVDDIYTTGSTADVVTQLLKRSGVQEVFLLTMAVGRCGEG